MGCTFRIQDRVPLFNYPWLSVAQSTCDPFENVTLDTLADPLICMMSYRSVGGSNEGAEGAICSSENFVGKNFVHFQMQYVKFGNRERERKWRN